MKDYISKDLALVLRRASSDLCPLCPYAVKGYISKGHALALCRASSDLCPLCAYVVKGYIRKGHALLGLKDTMKAMQAFQSAVDLDPNSTVSYIACFRTVTSGQ